jgi:hypothetical protein
LFTCLLLLSETSLIALLNARALLLSEISLIAPLNARALLLLETSLIAPLKKSAEGANYESQGQAPVLQGASPLGWRTKEAWSSEGADYVWSDRFTTDLV